MVFLETCTIKVAPLLIEKVFDVGFPVYQDRYIVGFSKFVYGYGGKEDHNVKEIFLELKSSIVDSTKIKVSILGVMFDNSKHEAYGDIDITVFAFSLDEARSDREITAITRFRVGYTKMDHHLQAYGVSSDGCFLHDASNHNQDINEVLLKTIRFPVLADATNLTSESIVSQGALISSFAIAKEEGDCCVKRLGIQAQPGYMRPSVDIIFEDKHKAQQLSWGPKTVVYVAVVCKTTDGKLGLYEGE